MHACPSLPNCDHELTCLCPLAWKEGAFRNSWITVLIILSHNSAQRQGYSSLKLKCYHILFKKKSSWERSQSQRSQMQKNEIKNPCARLSRGQKKKESITVADWKCIFNPLGTRGDQSSPEGNCLFSSRRTEKQDVHTRFQSKEAVFCY